jgi:hypothetical protein
MKDMNIHQFNNYFKNDSFKSISRLEEIQLTPKLRTSMLDLILRCPVPNSSRFGLTFSELGLFNKSDFISTLKNLKDILKIKLIDQYYWEDIFLQDDWFEMFKVMKEKNKSFVYMYKSGPHLETLFSSLRNAIAHGQFIIENNFITLWNISKQNNIKALIHIKTSMFKEIVEILNRAYVSNQN